MAELKKLALNKDADRRLRAGHLWIYSNEVNTKATPLKEISLGEQVLIESAQGKALGIAYINPNNLICGRLISRDSKLILNKSLLVHRINIALSLREMMNPKPFYRLVYGDSDNLPGLVVDRFGDYCVVQITTVGMELHKEAIVEALDKCLKPKGILFRNDGRMRSQEGLEEYTDVALGEVPDFVEIEENGVKFAVPVKTGQKTGWFYDHRANRARLADYVKGKKVLDLFSYIGGWGVQAASFGAAEVSCVDSSEFALDCVQQNAELNNVADQMVCYQGNAFDALKQFKQEQQRFDVVVLDPPAFIPKRKDQKKGLEAYRAINELAMRVLNKDGILVSASCSMHLSQNNLVDILRRTSRHLDRNLQILEQGGQTYDHPVHPAIPETEYLKAVFARVLPV